MPAPQHLRETGAVCWDGASEETLVRSLDAPASDCIELGLSTEAASTDPIDGGHGRLGLTVSIRSVYRLAIAKAFVTAVDHRLGLCEDMRDRIHTALHEVLLNAVMHGHLKLEAGLRDTLAGFGTAHDIITRELASDRFAQSKVSIEAEWTSDRLLIAVRDNGVGFETGRAPVTPHRGGGRGLLILEAFCDSVTYLDSGATILLGFML